MPNARRAVRSTHTQNAETLTMALMALMALVVTLETLIVIPCYGLHVSDSMEVTPSSKLHAMDYNVVTTSP